MLARRPWGGKLAAVAVAAISTLSWTQARAQQADCARSRAPIRLNFQTESPPPSYNHQLTLSGVAGEARSQGSPAEGASRPVGLTTIVTFTDVRGGTSTVKRGGSYCTYLTSVDVKFGWSAMQVFVPSEYREGSCEYRAVIDHENQHVAIYRATLREFAPRARARIEALLARSQPISSRAQNANVNAALAPVSAELSALLGEFNALHSARHRQIDNPSNYAAVTAMCKNWDGKQN